MSCCTPLVFIVHVQIPQSLFKKEGYDHREALFGVPPYGGSIAQSVYYANSDLCDPNVDTSKGYPQTEDGKGWPSPYILMLDRGGCTFVKKVSLANDGLRWRVGLDATGTSMAVTDGVVLMRVN
jgi:hypothetical protein